MGKYPDRDYTLDGLGRRMDNVEDLITGVVEPVKEIVTLVKRWAPILVVAAASNGYISAHLGGFLGAVFQGAGWK